MQCISWVCCPNASRIANNKTMMPLSNDACNAVCGFTVQRVSPQFSEDSQGCPQLSASLQHLDLPWDNIIIVLLIVVIIATINIFLTRSTSLQSCLNPSRPLDLQIVESTLQLTSSSLFHPQPHHRYCSIIDHHCHQQQQTTAFMIYPSTSEL